MTGTLEVSVKIVRVSKVHFQATIIALEDRILRYFENLVTMKLFLKFFYPAFLHDCKPNNITCHL